MKRYLLLAAMLLAFGPGSPALAKGPKDTLKSMKKELDRNMKDLSIPDYPRPYFISYLMRDFEISGVSARFGAAVQDRSDRQRFVQTDVRVGSPELDNTEDIYPGFDMPFVFQPLKNRAPLGDDDLALRKVLWNITDSAYKRAVGSYLKVKAKKVYEANDPDFSGSFSKAATSSHIAKPAEFLEDLDKYRQLVIELSATLSEIEFIFDSSVSFDANRHNRYFVNSEGAMAFSSDTFFSYSVQAFARAEDGSVIPHSFVLYARKLEELPSAKDMTKNVEELVTELDGLRKAEVLQPYNGPTLLEGDTAGVFLHEALGHRLEGHRQSGLDAGGTFSGKVGDQILPKHISVYDDPTMNNWEGQGVNGHYIFDDEGVEAQRVTLVDDGELSGFLLTRKPIEDFKESNGHARSSGTQQPVARMGTLLMESKTTVPAADLKKLLIESAKRQGKPFAIILRRAAGGATNTSSWGFQAFKGVARLVYKVDLESGEETLVRGVELVGTPLASLMKIEMVGDDKALFNGYCGAESGFIPVSTLTPSLILSELEFQKSPPRREQKEILPPPE